MIPCKSNEQYFFDFMKQEKILFDKEICQFFRTIKYRKKLEIPLLFCPNGSAHQYQRLVFFYKQQTRTCVAHRIVWQIFNGAIPEGMQVDHINGIKNDNRISNLQLLSPSQNIEKMHKQRRLLNV